MNIKVSEYKQIFETQLVIMSSDLENTKNM